MKQRLISSIVAAVLSTMFYLGAVFLIRHYHAGFLGSLSYIYGSACGLMVFNFILNYSLWKKL